MVCCVTLALLCPASAAAQKPAAEDCLVCHGDPTLVKDAGGKSVSLYVDPDNLGHFYFNGCFRCHDGQHASPQGKVISKDCNLCHTVIDQVEGAITVAAGSN
jgi:hypothetical protein